MCRRGKLIIFSSSMYAGARAARAKSGGSGKAQGGKLLGDG